VPSQTPLAFADGGGGDGAVPPWSHAAMVMANTSINGPINVRIMLFFLSLLPAGSIPRHRHGPAIPFI
jgi:hypothetical protein